MWVSQLLIIGIILAVIFIIVLALSIVFGILSEHTYSVPEWPCILCSVLTILSLVSGAVCIPLGAVETETYNKEYNDFVCNLVSLRTQVNTEGHFALGTGTIEGVDYYYYGYESVYGFGQAKTEVKKSFIVEDDSKTPSLYHIKEKGLVSDRYVYYVPTGTIKVYYTVN